MKIKERHVISNRIKKNTNTDRVDKAHKTFKEEIEKWNKKREEEDLWATIKVPYIPSEDDYKNITVCHEKSDVCLHKNCTECKRGVQNHVHMISCPCRDCSPRMTATTGYLQVAHDKDGVAYL